jgi:hypothetical protein
MDDTKLKYVRLAEYDEIIIFPMILEHSTFKYLNPISAGFCYIDDGKVSCFGNSVSLKLNSMEDDSKLATKQVFGINAMIALL